MPRFDLFFRNGRELALVAGLVAILVVLFAPIPPMLLDLGMIANFCLALTIFLMTLYVAKPVEFSTFPSLLLISTLLRLSLNVAATRLILTEADAGQVIGSIGAFAVSGNFVVGLVVFLILVVVQYVVITSGAQRVSEVAARFTLDSMPGQQMSIDADLNMGLIDQKEAIRRRSALEKEAAFYGAMDGASKFVKGDAIAGIIILLINIVAGWIIGVMQMGMEWGEALRHFTLLTVGDGIATQAPALIISLATGIIVTRSGADKELSTEIFKQFSAMPRVPLIAAGIVCLLLLLPGMPKWPILILMGGAFFLWRGASAAALAADAGIADQAAASEAATASSGTPHLSVALGRTLGESWRPQEAAILERIAGLRDAHERMFGLAFPQLSIVDGPALAPHEYEIRLFGARYGGGEIFAGQQLAIRNDQRGASLDGPHITDPAFGLPARWIEEAETGAARDRGYTIVDATTVFITHLGEILKAEAATLLTRGAVVSLLEEVRARQAGLVEELIPASMSISDVQRVLQNLLAEGVSIAVIDLIVEHLADLARTEKDHLALTELLRQRLNYSICNRLKGRHRDLAVLSLDPRLEHQIGASLAAGSRRDLIALDPRLTEQLLRSIAQYANDMIANGREPVLLCGAEVRRPLKVLTRRSAPRLSVVSVNEIPSNIDLSSFGIIKIEAPDAASSDRFRSNGIAGPAPRTPADMH
ncbi:MAG: flagellar biosynthesis protein FlhA [Terricaulis sp.]